MSAIQRSAAFGGVPGLHSTRGNDDGTAADAVDAAYGSYDHANLGLRDAAVGVDELHHQHQHYGMAGHKRPRLFATEPEGDEDLDHEHGHEHEHHDIDDDEVDYEAHDDEHPDEHDVDVDYDGHDEEAVSLMLQPLVPPTVQIHPPTPQPQHLHQEQQQHPGQGHPPCGTPDAPTTAAPVSPSPPLADNGLQHAQRASHHPGAASPPPSPSTRRYDPHEVSEAKRIIDRADERVRAAHSEVESAALALEEARRRHEVATMARAEADAEASRVGAAVCDVLLGEERCFWNLKYRELIEYRRVHGHTNVTRGFHSKICKEDDQIRKLGVWVGHQRRAFRKDPKEIRTDRIHLLDRIGFQWDPMAYQWNAKFEELKSFKAEHGHCRVPASYKQNRELGYWVREQRVQYRNMQRFQKEGGSPALTPKTPTTEAEMGSPGTGTKRKSKKDKVLAEDRYKLLQSAGFEWDIYEAYFDEGFELLMAYKRVHMGDTNVPKDFPPNPRLADWVQEVRKHYKRYQEGTVNCKFNNCLNDDRIKRLEDADFFWTEGDAIWMKRWQSLMEYVRLHNNDVSHLREDDPSLQNWVLKQRSEFKRLRETGKSNLNEWRIRNLEKLGEMVV